MNSSSNLAALAGSSFGLFAVAFAVSQVVMALVLAIVVQCNAQRLQRDGNLFLSSHWLWFFVVLLSGGYLATFAYWVIHYSSLRYRPEPGA